MIRILVVDDHPVVRAGLVGTLSGEAGLEVVGEAADGEQAVQRALALRPDVVLMDLRMPRCDGVTATDRLLAELPGTRVLVLTTYGTDAEIVRAVGAGACGYLLKDAPTAELAAAVLVDRMRSGPPEPEPSPLTPREVEVLAAVAEGLSNAEVGRRLHIGEATVKTHLLRVFAKLDVADRTRAVTEAMARGILPSPGPR